MTAPRWLLTGALVAAPGLATGAAAQAIARGVVIDADSRAPIPGAVVTLLSAGTSATTDRLGRFSLALRALPDSLWIAAIGWRPTGLALRDPPPALAIALERAPTVVSDLIVVAPTTRPLDLSELGRWRMPAQVIRSAPPAVEPDVYRALAMTPAVSFTSPFSARPMVRGYDAQEVATRIDGFEVLNLFHLGRVFSAFPADAAEDVSVAAAPFTAGTGGSVAGVVDIAGRSGQAGRTRLGAGTSLGSIGAWVGGGGRTTRYFTAARLLHLAAIDLVPGASFPYHFEDVYGSVVFGSQERPDGRVTVFATQDHVGDDSRSLGWTNLLLGARKRLVERGPLSLESSSAVSHFDQTGLRVPSGFRSEADFHNRFVRWTNGLELQVLADRSRLAVGISGGWRQIANRIAASDPRQPGGPGVGQSFSELEGSGFLEVSRQVGPLTAEASLRTEVLGRSVVVDPRLHLRVAVGPRVELGAALGRASRLYQLVADARSEPDLEYLDFWLSPSDSVPIARVRHATVDLSVDLSPAVTRISAYQSEGTGVGELRPTADQVAGSPAEFRFGRSRTRGLEIQVGLRGAERRRHAASVTYVVSRSERNWTGAWVPWAQDRRHQLRAFGQTGLGRVRLMAALDASTGMPLTPIVGWARRRLPGASPFDATGYLAETAIYGIENSVATAGTVRVDGALSYSFGGPEHRRFTFGASVINLFASPVAPIETVGEGNLAHDQLGRPTGYRRLFDLPPIPTLTLRVEF